jgi:Flp pilus assembly protein TadD
MWSRFRTELLALAGAACLVACGSAPSVPDASSAETRPDARAPDAPAGASTGEAVPAGAGSTAPPVEVPARAAAEFARAVELMRAGNAGEAALEFEQLAAGYPQLAGPHVNLGILHRKAGRLDAAVEALRAAVQRNPGNAIAWNELGVTLRMRGEFAEAAAAYERAIAIDPALAAAHRNLGVLRDLYLGDAPGALDAFEKYRSLTGEDRQVTGWIAELRQRTGSRRTAPPPVESVSPETSPEATPPQGSAGVPP